MKKITFILCWILYITPSFAQSLYHIPLGGSLYVHTNQAHYDYAAVNAFFRIIRNPRYATWLEVCLFNSDISDLTAHFVPNSIDIGVAGRYHYMPGSIIVGGHCFFIVQPETVYEVSQKAHRLSESQQIRNPSIPQSKHTWHLTAINPGFELAWPKYHTAFYAHVKIQLPSKEESSLAKESKIQLPLEDEYSLAKKYRYQAKKLKWGGEITSKTNIPHFSLGVLPVPHSTLTIGMYGDQYTHHPFTWGVLAKLEMHFLRFASVAVQKDQLTPISVGLKLHFGWQGNEQKPMPYYLYNPFNRYLAYHLCPKPESKSSTSESAQSDYAYDSEAEYGITLQEVDPMPEQEVDPMQDPRYLNQ